MKTLIPLFLIATAAAQVSASECFSDKNLLSLQASDLQRGTLVYVWSPRMSFSRDNAATAFNAAAATGLDFIVLHDARVPSEEIKQATAANLPTVTSSVSATPTRKVTGNTEQPRGILLSLGGGLGLATPPLVVSPLSYSRPLCSEKLIQSEALRHFPSAFVIGKQGIHANPIVGAMPMDAWVSSIKQRLASP